MGKIDVNGLPLSSLTVAYYYVEYGTNLAFLSRPNENYCPEALPVLQEVLQAYPNDVSLTGIATDSLGICARLQGGGVTLESTPQATSTATPSP
jgi:hypothetical protein